MTTNFLSRTMGLSYRDTANDNFKRRPLDETECVNQGLMLDCPTGYWIYSSNRWLTPENYASFEFPDNDHDQNEAVAGLLIYNARIDDNIDVGVPLRYLPDRCQSGEPLQYRKAAR